MSAVEDWEGAGETAEWGDNSAYNGGGEEVTEWAAPESGGGEEWEAIDDGEGGHYYYNTITGETAWELPGSAMGGGGDSGYSGGVGDGADDGTLLGWQEAFDDEGNMYYMHAETGAVQWEVPEEMQQWDVEDGVSGGGVEWGGEEFSDADDTGCGGFRDETGQPRRNTVYDVSAFDLSRVPKAIVDLLEFMCEEVEYGNVGREERHAARRRRKREKAALVAAESKLSAGIDKHQMHPEEYYAQKRRLRRRALAKARKSAREKRAAQAAKTQRCAATLRAARKKDGLPDVPPRFTVAMLDEIEAAEAEHRWEQRVAAREAGKLTKKHRAMVTQTRNREATAKMLLMKKVMLEITQGKELKGLQREEAEEAAILSGANVQSMTQQEREAADALRRRLRAAEHELEALASTVFDVTQKTEAVALAAGAAQEREEVLGVLETLLHAVETEIQKTSAGQQQQQQQQQQKAEHKHKHKRKHHEHIEHTHVVGLPTHDPWEDTVPKSALLKVLLEDPSISEAAKVLPGLAMLLEEPWREKIGARNHYLDALTALETGTVATLTKPEWMEFVKVCADVAKHAKAARDYMAKVGLGKESDAKAAWEKKLAERRSKEAARHYRKSGRYLSDLERMREQYKAEMLCVEIQLSVAKKFRRAVRKLAAWGAFRRLLLCAQHKQETTPWWRQKHQPLLISVNASWAPPSIPGGNAVLYNCEARHRVYLQKAMLRDAKEKAWRDRWDETLVVRAECHQELVREEQRALLLEASARAGSGVELGTAADAACDCAEQGDKLSATDAEQVRLAVAAVVDATCAEEEKEQARQEAERTQKQAEETQQAAQRREATAASVGTAEDYLLALQEVYTPNAPAIAAAPAPAAQASEAIEAAKAAKAGHTSGTNDAWSVVRDQAATLVQREASASSVTFVASAAATRKAAHVAAAAAISAATASEEAARSVTAAARSRLALLKARFAEVPPRPPLAAHTKLRHDLARKVAERRAMRSMAPHERLQVLRAGFLPRGDLERHFAVRAEVRARVRTRQRLRQLDASERLAEVKRAAAADPSAAARARRAFIREVQRRAYACTVREQVAALLGTMVHEVELDVQRSEEHLRVEVSAALRDLTLAVHRGVMRAEPVFYEDDVEAAINDAVWERRLLFVEAEEARESERRGMAHEEALARLAVERDIRFQERVPRLVQESGRRDFHALQQRCLCPPPLLMRLTWERTMVPGRHQMTVLVRDPSDGNRYIYQASPCANPADAEFVVEQAEAFKDFRSPFVARVRDVFGFRYQSFNTSGLAVDNWHQVIVLTEYCEGGELIKHIADRQRAPDEAEVQQWTLQLCAGLSAMHSRDLLHRNINPGNVYLDAKGNIRLASFQFAKLARPVTKLLAHRRCVGGTPQTLAPELERMEEPTAKSDVWAMGCVLFRLITGDEPAQLALRNVADITGRPSLQFGLKLRHVLRMCLHEDVGMRADAQQVFSYLSLRAKPPRIDARTAGPVLGVASNQDEEEQPSRSRRVLPPLADVRTNV